MAPLTEEQVTIIQNTWKIPDEELLEVFILIFTTFLERYPHNQDKFNKFRNTPLEQLKGSPKLRTHASRIKNVFDQTVSALGRDDVDDELRRIWNDVADVHFKAFVNRLSFEELKNVILETLAIKGQLDDTQQLTWNTLMDYVYTTVYETIVE